jgi:uncharacterized membrane protein
MVRVLIATLLGGVILFGWGWVSHAALPWWHDVTGELPDEAAVTRVLQETSVASGVIVFPSWLPMDEMQDEAAMEAWAARHREGPVGLLIYHAEGLDPMNPRIFLVGFLISLGCALVAALLLHAARGSLRSYLARVLFVGGLGLILALATDLVQWCWMYYPLDYTLVAIADHVIGWLLVGLVLGVVVRPTTAAGQ